MSDQDSAEQQPLLPISIDNPGSRVNNTLLTWRENVARFLESVGLHSFVLTLVRSHTSSLHEFTAHTHTRFPLTPLASLQRLRMVSSLTAVHLQKSRNG